MTKTIKSLFRWQPSSNYANKKPLKDDRVASVGFLLFMVSGTRIRQKHCIYSESHLTHLASGLLLVPSFSNPFQRPCLVLKYEKGKIMG